MSNSVPLQLPCVTPEDLFITLAPAKIPFTFFHLLCDKGTLCVTSKKKNKGAATIPKNRSTCMQIERISIEGRDNVKPRFAVFVILPVKAHVLTASIWSVLHLCKVYINTYSAGKGIPFFIHKVFLHKVCIIIYDLNLACIDSRCTVHCPTSNSQIKLEFSEQKCFCQDGMLSVRLILLEGWHSECSEHLQWPKTLPTLPIPYIQTIFCWPLGVL